MLRRLSLLRCLLNSFVCGVRPDLNDVRGIRCARLPRKAPDGTVPLPAVRGHTLPELALEVTLALAVAEGEFDLRIVSEPLTAAAISPLVSDVSFSGPSALVSFSFGS